MDIVAYIGLSVGEPADDALAQRGAIDAWARGAACDVVAALTDDAEGSGEALSTRLALGDALEMVHEGKAAGIVVSRLERLSGDVTMQELLRADLALVGAALRSADAPEDAALQGAAQGERKR